MKPLRFLLGFIACGFIAGLFGQTGQLKFTIDPGHSYQVKLDGDSIYAQRVLEVAPGSHHVVIWSPGYIPVDTTVTVQAGRTTEIFKFLKKRADYAAFIAERDNMLFSSNRQLTATLLLSVGALAYSGFKYVHMRRSYSDIQDHRTLFENSAISAVVKTAEVDFNLARDDFYGHRGAMRTSLALSAVSAGVSYLLIKRRNKILLPVYKDDYRPTFERLGLQVIPLNEDRSKLIPGINLTMRL